MSEKVEMPLKSAKNFLDFWGGCPPLIAYIDYPRPHLWKYLLESMYLRNQMKDKRIKSNVHLWVWVFHSTVSEPKNIQMLYFSLSFSSVLTHIFPNHVEDSRENIVTRRALIFSFLGPNSSACCNRSGLTALSACGAPTKSERGSN